VEGASVRPRPPFAAAGGRATDASGDAPTAVRGRLRLSIAAYVVVFAVLLARLIAASGTSYGRGNNPVDARLLTWTQASVARSLRDAPRSLFDAPIFHPAPDQLAGAESYLSNQIVFGPVFWATGNAVLAANAVILASYPIGALAMERLLLALGAAPLVAWVTGLLFALGPMAVPANIQITQYLPLYLPLTALVLRRLRDRPTWARACLFAVVFLLAVTSSYYMAVLAGLVAAGWTAIELASSRPGRGTFVARVVPAGAVVALALVAISRPYLERHAAEVHAASVRAAARATRPEGVAPQPAGEAPGPAGAAPGVPPAPTSGSVARPDERSAGDVPLVVLLFWPPRIDVSLVVAIAGLAAFASRSRVARALAARGVVFVALGAGLLLVILTGTLTPLPSFLGFFRNPFRLTAVTGFGVALLSGAALEAARAATRRPVGALAALAVAGILVATRGREVVSPTLDPVAPLTRDAAVYRELARVAGSEGGGPLLELPASGPQRDMLFTDAMVASTVHDLPLVTGFGPVFPLHWPLVASAIDRLPAPDALQELVDMTGLRWILLRPERDWPTASARDDMAARLDVPADARRPLDGFVLLHVDRPQAHGEWADALRRGYVPGTSLLGAPYEPLPAGAAGGEITAPAAAATTAGHLLSLPIAIANRGAWTWPGALSGNGGAPGEAFVAVRWWPAPTGGAARGGSAAWGSDVGLRRDVSPGDVLRQALLVPAPRAPGRWVVRLEVAQRIAGRPARPLAVPADVGVSIEPAR